MADTTYNAPNSIPNDKDGAYWAKIQKDLDEQMKQMKFPNRGNPVGNPKPLNMPGITPKPSAKKPPRSAN